MGTMITTTEIDRLLSTLTAATGETPEQALARALEERIDRIGNPLRSHPLTKAERQARLERLRAISREASKLPVLDPRSDDEILGYNDIGTFD